MSLPGPDICILLLQEAHANPPSAPAEVCLNSHLRAANIFHHRSPAAGLGITGMSAPKLGVVLEGHSTAPCGQAYSRTTDISGRCCKSKQTGKSRYKGNDTMKAGLMHLHCIPHVCIASCNLGGSGVTSHLLLLVAILRPT